MVSADQAAAVARAATVVAIIKVRKIRCIAPPPVASSRGPRRHPLDTARRLSLPRIAPLAIPQMVHTGLTSPQLSSRTDLRARARGLLPSHERLQPVYGTKFILPTS